MRTFSILAVGTAVLLIMVGTGRTEETKSWTDKITLSGDFRYRNEGIYTETLDSAGTAVNVPDRVRHRIRLRLSATAKINKWWDAGLRLASSTATSADAGDPISTNQDLGGGLTPKAIWLDRAYAVFKPVKEISVTGGKFGVPYHYTDLHFDPDLNLEGIVFGAQGANKDAVLMPFLRAGGYWIQERSAGPDQAMFGGQIGARFQQDAVTLTGAAAYYDYTNVKGHPTLFSPSRGYGNTTGGGTYANDFDIVDANLQAQFKLGEIETLVQGNYIRNMDPDSENTAWLGGVTLNGKAPVEWDLGYNYRVIERDAVIGAFTDSDFAGGGTNAEGHRVWAGVSPVAGTRLGVTWFVNQRDPDGSDLHYERLMADLEVKF